MRELLLSSFTYTKFAINLNIFIIIFVFKKLKATTQIRVCGNFAEMSNVKQGFKFLQLLLFAFPSSSALTAFSF